MKKIILVGALIATAAFTSTAFASANYDIKGTSNTDTNGNGNLVATYSSSGTGNGGVVGGNGTSYDNSGIDQTDAPGSRATAVHALGVGAASLGSSGKNH